VADEVTMKSRRSLCLGVFELRSEDRLRRGDKLA
jgi:hypothetical protein